LEESAGGPPVPIPLAPAAATEGTYEIIGDAQLVTDDESEEDRPPPFDPGIWRPARTGLQLTLLAAWLYIGALGLVFLLGLLSATGASVPYGLFALAALPGLANWVVSGLGFYHAWNGPDRYGSRRLVQLALAASGGHLLLLLLGVLVSHNWMALASAMPDTAQLGTPWIIDRLDEYAAQGQPWLMRFQSGHALIVLVGLAEAARFVLCLLYVRTVALTVQELYLADEVASRVVRTPVTLGVLVFLSICFGLFIRLSFPDAPDEYDVPLYTRMCAFWSGIVYFCVAYHLYRYLTVVQRIWYAFEDKRVKHDLE
jgi:hypothetical protein